MSDERESWPRKPEAARLLRVSIRTLERLHSQGKVRVEKLETKFGPEARFDPRSLDEYRREREAAGKVHEALFEKPRSGHKASPLTSFNLGGDITGIVALLRDAMAEARRGLLPPAPEAKKEKPRVEVSEKLSLSIQEAAALAGFSKGYLLQAVSDGKLKGAKRAGKWNIKRSDLESWVKKL